MEYKITLNDDEHGLDQAALRKAIEEMSSRLLSVDRRTKEGKQLLRALTQALNARDSLDIFLEMIK